MKVIGLTGGIGSGKSTVSDLLKKRGYTVIDADEISRKETQNGGEAIEDIRLHFGNDVFLSDGSLDRKKLGDIVFNDRNQLKVLEKITTDVVIKKVNDIVKVFKNEGYEKDIFVDAPLLFECSLEKQFDEIWLVKSPIDLRIKRVIERDNVTEKQVLDRIKNQMSDEEKENKSTHVLDNSLNFEYLEKQVLTLLNEK